MSELERKHTSEELAAVAQGGASLMAMRAADEAEEALSLRHYLAVLQRRKWLVLSIMVSALTLAAVQVLTTTPLYRASATLQIDPIEPKVLPYEDLTAPPVSPKAAEEYMGTQARKLRTRTLARRVVERLDLTNDDRYLAPSRRGLFLDSVGTLTRSATRLVAPAASRRPVEEIPIAPLLRGIEVRPVRQSRLIEVSYLSPDPQLGATILNTLVDEFIEQHFESYYEATTKTTSFLRRQLEDLRAKVETSEERLIAYARANDIVNLTEKVTINQQKLADLSRELTLVEIRLASDDARYSLAAGSTPQAFPQPLQTASIAALEERLSELEQRRASLSTRYGARWPAMQQLASEIETVAARLEAEKASTLSGASADYSLARAEYENLGAAIEEQRAVVDLLNESSIQYNILQREVQTDRQLYEGLLQRLKEANVAAGLRSNTIQIADRAEVARLPALPDKSLAFLVSLVLGCCLGIGSAIVVDNLDNTIKSTDDVSQHLRLAPLGLIPNLEMAEGKTTKRKVLSSGRRGRSPIVAYGGQARARGQEAYRSLRTSLLLSHSGKPPQTIMITSALPSEGKTTTATNTALALAQTGARTLLVDLDLRKPALAELFGISAQQGMSTFLTGNSDLASQIRETKYPNLFVVPAGPRAPNPAELIGSHRMRSGLDLLQEYFTYVVIDSPPTLEIADSLVLSRQVEGVLLVARAGRTSRDAVRKARNRLLGVGATLLGVVLNDIDVRSSEYGYYSYSYYGSYYGGPDTSVEPPAET